MNELAKVVGSNKFWYAHEAGSPFLVAIIPEFHDLPACQAQVYETLEALDPVTSFVAVEGRIGEVRHDEIGGAYRLEDRIDSYLALADRPVSERRMVARAWANNGALPWEVGFDVPVPAALLHEVVQQDGVRSQGLENRDVFLRAHRVAALYEQAGAAGAVRILPIATIIGARNRVFARKLRHYGTYLAEHGRDVVPFPVGAAHVNDLTRRLRHKRISYAIILNSACISPP